MVTETITFDAGVQIAKYAGLAALVNLSMFIHSESGAPDSDGWQIKKAAPIIAFGALAGAGVWLSGGEIAEANIEALAAVLAVAANEMFEAARDVRGSVSAARDRGESPQQQVAAGAGAAMGHANRLNDAAADVSGAFADVERTEGPPPEPVDAVDEYEHDADEHGSADGDADSDLDDDDDDDDTIVTEGA